MTVKHVVLFDYAETAPEAEIQAVIAGLNELPGKIDTIRDWSLVEDLGKRPGSFRFCLIAHFDDMAAMEAYLAHPAHVKAVERAMAILTKLAEHDHHI
jgi:quinol monooxygenase YgiN